MIAVVLEPQAHQASKNAGSLPVTRLRFTAWQPSLHGRKHKNTQKKLFFFMECFVEFFGMPIASQFIQKRPWHSSPRPSSPALCLWASPTARPWYYLGRALEPLPLPLKSHLCLRDPQRDRAAHPRPQNHQQET